MNTSQFMDKQIMDLSSSSLSENNNQNKDFIDLMNRPQDEDNGGHQTQKDLMGSQNNEIKEDIFPSYDFQPIRPLGPSHSIGSSIGAAANSRIRIPDGTRVKNYTSLDSIEPALLMREKDRSFSDSSMVAEIDRLMKNHTDNLVHVLDGVSARLTQLESRTRHLENSVDDLKISIGKNHGSTDGKMRQLENILREVQTGVQVLKDRQDIMETQLQLSKLKVSRTEQSLEKENTAHVDSAYQSASAPVQSQQQFPAAESFAPQHAPIAPAAVSAPPPAPVPQNLPPGLPPQLQLPSHFPHTQMPSVAQREGYYPPPAQLPDAANQQYQVPHSQQSQAPPGVAPAQPFQPAPPPQPYQPAPPAPQFSQPPQPQPSHPHHPEEMPYPPPQSYPPNVRQPPSQPPSGSAPTHYGSPGHIYDTPSSRGSSGFSSGYIPQSGSAELYPYGGTAPQYGSGSPMKPSQFTPASAPGSGLPTARILPQALPTASAIGSGSNSPGSGNRVPVDDVVDKVTSMGFPREHVRATVRRLTENGQSVDLNVVLDKLMNEGNMQPQRGWFGR